MYLLNLDQMFAIRNNIIAKNQSINFYSEMSSYLYDKYPHMWRYVEQVAKSDVEVKFDKEYRQWRAIHKNGLFEPTSFDKKPSKTMITLKVFWQIAKEISKGSRAFG